MQLTILGSGTSAPHPERAAPANWLQTAKGSLIMDFGASTAYRVAHEQLDWVNLDAIWISHFHLDHVGGLVPFLFGTRHAPQIQSRRKPLSIFGPKGFKDLLLKLDEAAKGKLFEQPFPLVVEEVSDGEPFEPIVGISATTFSTPHTTESLAIRIEDGDGRTVAYTSDTGYSESLDVCIRSGFTPDGVFVLQEQTDRHTPRTEGGDEACAVGTTEEGRTYTPLSGMGRDRSGSRGREVVGGNDNRS